MSLTAEATGRTLRIVDTELGVLAELPFFTSVALTTKFGGRCSIPTATTNQAVDFGSLTDAKFIAIRTDAAGELTFKLNGGTEVHSVNPILLIVASDGGYTGMTVSNASGETVVFDYIIGE